MVLRYASPARLELSKRTSVRAPLLSALALLGMALASLLAPGGLTPSRGAFVAFLVGVSLLLLASSLPRRSGIRISLDTGLFEHEARRTPLGRVRFLALTTAGDALDRTPRARYRVEASFDDGEQVVLLERADPARVLADLRTLLGHWSVPLRRGWGLPETAEPWRESGPALSKPVTPLSVSGRPHESELGAGLCTLGGGLVIGTAMTVMHLSRIRRGELTDALSFALSGITLSLVLLIAAFLLTDRVVAETRAGELVLTRRALGLALSTRRVPLERLRGVYAVGMSAASPHHLLVDDGQLFSVRFAGDGAERFARGVLGDPVSRQS